MAKKKNKTSPTNQHLENANSILTQQDAKISNTVDLFNLSTSKNNKQEVEFSQRLGNIINLIKNQAQYSKKFFPIQINNESWGMLIANEKAIELYDPFKAFNTLTTTFIQNKLQNKFKDKKFSHNTEPNQSTLLQDNASLFAQKIANTVGNLNQEQQKTIQQSLATFITPAVTPTHASASSSATEIPQSDDVQSQATQAAEQTEQPSTPATNSEELTNSQTSVQTAQSGDNQPQNPQTSQPEVKPSTPAKAPLSVSGLQPQATTPTPTFANDFRECCKEPSFNGKPVSDQRDAQQIAYRRIQINEQKSNADIQVYQDKIVCQEPVAESITTMAALMAKIKDKAPSKTVLITGGDEQEIQQLAKACQAKGLQPYVMCDGKPTVWKETVAQKPTSIPTPPAKNGLFPPPSGQSKPQQSTKQQEQQQSTTPTPT